MDAIKNAVGKAGNSGSSGASSGGQKEDYGDKGADFVNKKYLGGKMSSDQREKVTDAGREGVEKSTGKDIPSKFSN
ncbi:hypothetical protein E0Z10_g7503 [Xylaria hypoxylon]|uniref:Uncharacterized protein n=1 Tax=Xylaria hypoxylon TaxID=37992 RepID=A0A4Z0YXZ0_9PEZI|nr:hypothetical protein E0Z10_g7503 [Xylaria hypoxylon]